MCASACSCLLSLLRLLIDHTRNYSTITESVETAERHDQTHCCTCPTLPCPTFPPLLLPHDRLQSTAPDFLLTRARAVPPKVSCPGLDPAVGCQVPGSVPCSPPLVDSHSPESQLGSNQHWRRGRARFRQPESLCFAVCLLARLLHWLADLLLLLARSACPACRRPLPLLRPVLTTFHLTTTTACTTTPTPRPAVLATACGRPTVRLSTHAVVANLPHRPPPLSNRYLPYLPDLPTPTYRPTTFSRCPAPTLFGPTACLPACLPADLRLSELTAL